MRFSKTLCSIVALFGTGTKAEDSNYKVRIHKSLIKEILDKNFPVALEHIESKKEKNVFLTEINANIDDLSLKIQPEGGQDWDKMTSDLFFDNGQIVMELNGLEFAGNGHITDPSTGIQESLTFNAAIELCQLVLTPDQEATDEGNVYPKIEITEIVFQLHPDGYVINAQGDLPLYRNKQFEDGIKKWMKTQSSAHEKDFKLALQVSEREIMNSFAFKKELKYGSAIRHTLGETISLVGDHIVMAYQNDLEGNNEVLETKKQLRRIETAFSDEDKHMKDVQLVIDENYVNYILLDMFHGQETFSVLEILVNYWPEGLYGGTVAIRGIMNAALWSTIFPDLKTHPAQTQVDFRCGMNKEFLKDGGLEENKVSKIQFKDNNIVNFDLHFGCSIYTFIKRDSELGPMEILSEIFQSLEYNKDSPEWNLDTAFFISTNGDMQFEFGQDAREDKSPLAALFGENEKWNAMKTRIPYVVGRMIDFHPTVEEVKVWRLGKVGRKGHEEHDTNTVIMKIKEKANEPMIKLLIQFFNTGIPMVPFPSIEHCLGLNAQDSDMQIVDGHAIIAYDFKVSKGQSKCLFNMKETLDQKKARLAEDQLDMSSTGAQKIFGKLQKHAQESAKLMMTQMPGLELPKDLRDFKPEQAFEGVKKAFEKGGAMNSLISEDIHKNIHDAVVFAENNKHHLEKAQEAAKGLFNFFQK